MNLKISRVLPKDISVFEGSRIIRFFTALFMLLVLVRSCIHLFASDGGAQSIAGVDTSVAGGNNIIAIFHQWGAIQLILALLLIVLFFRYPGLTPLILITLAMDPIFRYISGNIMPLTTEGTPPGEALNWPAFFLIVILLFTSLLDRSSRENNL
jgi:hypothetical protein